MAPPTYAIVSPDLYFPGLSETEKVVQAALLRILKARDPSVTTLPYEKARMARKRSQWLYERRLQRSGLRGLKDEQRDRVMALARSGGRMAGPLTMHQVDEWSAEVHYRSPWMGELTAHLMRHMRYRVSVGRIGFSLMPLLIVGDTGNGKSTYAQILADVAGVPVRGVDVAGGSSAFRIAGLEKGWGSAAEGIPVEMMLMNKVANPVIIVNEIDKAGEKIASMSGDRAVHIQHDILQAVAVVKPVDPLSVQFGQRRPVLGQCQRLCLEAPHLRGRGRLRIDSPSANNLTHDRVEREAVSIVDILVSGQTPEHRLPEQPVEPVDGVLATPRVAQRDRRKV